MSHHSNFEEMFSLTNIITPDRRQSKNICTINELRSKITINRFFYCHLSPDWRQMANKNTVSSDF